MFDTFVRKYQSWQKYRRTYDELSRLSNRELADLGRDPPRLQLVQSFGVACLR